jgi:serine/threonine-protein kinase HipA
MTRHAALVKYDKRAADLTETPELSVAFSYKQSWIDAESEWLALSMPNALKVAPVISPSLPPFLDGLIPEGWLLGLASRMKPELAKDRFGLLLATCGDAVGAVGVNDLDAPRKADQEASDRLPREALQGPVENPFGRCLVCAGPLEERANHYHDLCATRLFGTSAASLPFLQEQFEELAMDNIRAHLIVPGAQRKISASLLTDGDGRTRITLVGTGEGGLFILKPEHPQVSTFPANEHAAMMIAQAAGLETASFGLMLGPDGKLSYVTRRFDRVKRGKGPLQKRSMEDFGQIFGRVRDHEKYKESFDKIGKFLRGSSPQAIVDCARFFDQVFLSYLIGNNDFHLRNVSVFTEGNRPILTPAYDITITQLIDPEPEEDTTLPVNGRKNKIRRGDWFEFGMRMGMAEKAVQTRIEHFECAMPAIEEAAMRSFLPADEKTKLLKFTTGRMARALVSVPQVAAGGAGGVSDDKELVPIEASKPRTFVNTLPGTVQVEAPDALDVEGHSNDWKVLSDED